MCAEDSKPFWRAASWILTNDCSTSKNAHVERLVKRHAWQNFLQSHTSVAIPTELLTTGALVHSSAQIQSRVGVHREALSGPYLYSIEFEALSGVREHRDLHIHPQRKTQHFARATDPPAPQPRYQRILLDGLDSVKLLSSFYQAFMKIL